MLSPVWGFRPRRDNFWRIRKCPKPTILTSSPFSKHRKMISNTDSTTDADCRLDSPWAATALTRSFLVMVASPPSDEGFVALTLEFLGDSLCAGTIREASDTHAIQREGARTRRPC